MLPAHVFTLATRTMKKPLLTAASIALSFGVLLGSTPAFADPATEILGTYRDTSEPDQWIVKYLGTSSDWEKERSYTNGVLDNTGYVQAQAVNLSMLPWNSRVPWISGEQNTFAYGPVGYFSYVTIINDASITGVAPTTSFSGLSISFSADNWVSAFVINGVIYDGFRSAPGDGFWGYEDLFIPSDGNISWNVGGDNTVEIIVYNSGSPINNPTGLSATIQASYAPIPEPETWAMLLAGLGIVGAVTRRRA